MDTTLTTSNGAPIGDNENSLTVGAHGGPILLQDFTVIDKLAHFDREVIPERRVHARVRLNIDLLGSFYLFQLLKSQGSNIEPLLTVRNSGYDFRVLEVRLRRRIASSHICCDWSSLLWSA